MTDLDLLRLAARATAVEKVAYDPTAVARDAVRGGVGKPLYEVATEHLPGAVGGAVGGVLGTAGRVVGAPIRAATSLVPDVGPGLLGLLGKAGRRLGGEATHLARKSPVGFGLAAGLTYLAPPELLRPAAQVRGVADDLNRVAHGLPSSPVDWG